MGQISRKKLSRKSKNTSFAREKTFANGNNFLFFLFSFFVKQKFTNTKKSTSEAWSLTTPLPPIPSPFRHVFHHLINKWQNLRVWIENKSFFCKYRWFEIKVCTFTAAIGGFIIIVDFDDQRKMKSLTVFTSLKMCLISLL